MGQSVPPGSPLHREGGKTLNTVTHKIPLNRIGERIFWNSLGTYDRGFDPANNPDDKALVDSISARGILTPVIVYMDQTGAMYLVSGGRRLAALRHLGVDKSHPVPCHTVQCNYDALIAVLIVEAEEQDEDPLATPLTASQQLQFGLVARGWGAHARRYFRQADGTTRHHTTAVDEYYRFLLPLTRSEWQSLKLLACVYVAYEQRAGVNHDPVKAKELLEEVDAGELSIHQARERYVIHRAPTAKTGPSTPKEWREQTGRLSAAVKQLADVLLDYQVIPQKITDEELRQLRTVITASRTNLNTIIRSIDHRILHPNA